MKSSLRILTFAALFWSAAASADDSDETRAREAFNAGLAAMKRGDAGAACPRFEEAHRLHPRVGFVVNLARCEAKLGHLLAARNHYQEGAARARTEHDTRIGAVTNELDALERKIPKLSIRVPAPAPSGLMIFCDGVEIERSQPLMVDPGSHEIEARASGYETSRAVTTTSADGSTTFVELPALERTIVASKPASPPRHIEDEAPESSLGLQRWSAIGLAGAGAISLGVAGFFTLDAMSKNSDSGDGKGLEKSGLRNDAIDSGNSATALAIGGAVAIVAAGALWLTAPSRSRNITVGGSGIVGVW